MLAFIFFVLVIGALLNFIHVIEGGYGAVVRLANLAFGLCQALGALLLWPSVWGG